VAWGLATIIVALVALRGWLAYTDPIKAQHSSAWIFTSANVARGNWGLFDFHAMFSREVWGYLLWCWGRAVMAPWLIGAAVLAGVFMAPPWRRRALGLAALFLAPQLLFPFAYAYQDYYFYSCVVFLSAALACGLGGLLDSRAPRWVCGLLLAVILGAQLTTYWRGYWQEQRQVLPGGYPFTDAVRDLTPKNSVIVVAGADWAAMTPLYAQRKALMLRNGLEFDTAYQDRAYAELADEDVSAMVLWGPVRSNRAYIERAARAFNFDASAPTFSHPAADVYLRRPYIPGAQLRLRNSRQYPNVTIPAGGAAEPPDTPFAIPAPVARTAFARVAPAPQRGRFAFGLDLVEEGRDTLISAHPDSDLWVRAPAAATAIRWSFGYFPAAYERGRNGTDGAEFIITAETADGRRREIYRRLLDPVRQARDRGRQTEVIPYAPQPGEVLQFSTRPNKNPSYDWVYWAEITVQ